MKACLLLLVAACGSRATQDPPAPSTAPPATPTEPEKLGVVFERLLVDEDDPAPLFGPDNSVTVGARRWTADGAYAGEHAFARDGQLRPIAVAGTPDLPRVIALGWDELDDMPPAPPAEDRAWLLTADVRSEIATTTTPIHHELLGENNIELSPDGSAIVTLERTEVVVRAAATGIERSRHPIGAIDGEISFPEAHHICWLDDDHVAWIGKDKDKDVLRVAAVHGAIATTPLAQPTRILACDPMGDVAAIAVPGAIAVLDLANAIVTATHPVDEDRDHRVAIGARGQRVAIADNTGFTLYRRDGAALTRAYALVKPASDPNDNRQMPQLAFSRDGLRLAVTDATLLVIGDITSAPPAPTVPSFDLDLPRGFVANEPVDIAWRYAQLPAPSGAATVPSLLFQARADDDPFAHVIGLAVDRAELPRIPPDTATDAEMKAFAKRTMQRWFESWQFFDLAATNTDGYTIAVGRTNGMRWFETRELERSGCEPYDAYTRVVIDTHLVFIVRAITVPGAPIDDWLAPFLDVPFRARVKTALRKGPRSGPC